MSIHSLVHPVSLIDSCLLFPVNYLGAANKSSESTPYRLIGVYVMLSFLQGGGIGKFTNFFCCP